MLSKFYQVGDNMFYFYTKAQYGHAKGAGVIGNQSNKLYYYGLLLTADDYKYQVAKVGGYEFNHQLQRFYYSIPIVQHTKRMAMSLLLLAIRSSTTKTVTM